MATASAKTIAASLLITLPAVPAVADDGTANARVTASVREVCSLIAPPLAVSNDRLAASGQALETCNSGKSFAVAAVTRPLAKGEAISLRYGSDTARLSPGGTTTITRRSGPTFREVPLFLRADTLEGPVTVSLAISAI